MSDPAALLRALDAAASPGPWFPRHASEVVLRGVHNADGGLAFSMSQEDAALIVTLRNALEAIAALVDAARAALRISAHDYYDRPDHAHLKPLGAALHSLSELLVGDTPPLSKETE